MEFGGVGVSLLAFPCGCLGVAGTMGASELVALVDESVEVLLQLGLLEVLRARFPPCRRQPTATWKGILGVRKPLGRSLRRRRDRKCFNVDLRTRVTRSAAVDVWRSC